MATTRRTNSPRTKPTAKAAEREEDVKETVAEPAEAAPAVVIPEEEAPETGDSGAETPGDEETPDSDTESPETGDSEPEDGTPEGMSKAVVLTAAFSYVGDDGFTVTAYKGDTIDVTPAALKRGKALGAVA